MTLIGLNRGDLSISNGKFLFAFTGPSRKVCYTYTFTPEEIKQILGVTIKNWSTKIQDIEVDYVVKYNNIRQCLRFRCKKNCWIIILSKSTLVEHMRRSGLLAK